MSEPHVLSVRLVSPEGDDLSGQLPELALVHKAEWEHLRQVYEAARIARDHYRRAANSRAQEAVRNSDAAWPAFGRLADVFDRKIKP